MWHYHVDSLQLWKELLFLSTILKGITLYHPVEENNLSRKLSLWQFEWLKHNTNIINKWIKIIKNIDMYFSSLWEEKGISSRILECYHTDPLGTKQRIMFEIHWFWKIMNSYKYELDITYKCFIILRIWKQNWYSF